MYEIEEEKGNGRQKSFNARHTHHVRHVAKKITHQRDVGKALEPIFVPRGLDMMTKSMMTKLTNENPRSLITRKRPSQANSLLKSQSQKTNIAATPNTWL